MKLYKAKKYTIIGIQLKLNYNNDIATIDHIIAEFKMNSIKNRELFLNHRIKLRMKKLQNLYEEKLDKILTFIICRTNYETFSLVAISKVIKSINHVVIALSTGLTGLLNSLEE